MDSFPAKTCPMCVKERTGRIKEKGSLITQPGDLSSSCTSLNPLTIPNPDWGEECLVVSDKRSNTCVRGSANKQGFFFGAFTSHSHF